jgi:hypothetical protein
VGKLETEPSEKPMVICEVNLAARSPREWGPDMSKHDATLTDRLIDHAARLKRTEVIEDEKRGEGRFPFESPVVLVLMSFEGDVTQPILVQAVDISHGGLRVRSRHMIHPGALGAVQMMRSNGEVAIIGVQIRHCRYVGGMQHHTGMKFIPVPARFEQSHFMDGQGRPLLSEALRAQAVDEAKADSDQQTFTQVHTSAGG